MLLDEAGLTLKRQSATLEYRYEGVRQYCWKTRTSTIQSCEANGAANDRRESGLSIGTGFREKVSFIRASSALTA